MSLLPLVTAPDSRLNKKSAPVSLVDADLQKFMDDMIQTMRYENGIGLAAVQVGRNIRVITVDSIPAERNNGKEPNEPMYIINPEISSADEKIISMAEGCLSLPDQSIEVGRPNKIFVKCLDYNGKRQSFIAEGMLSRVIQHEYDHLEGKLLIDYVSSLKKDIIIRKLKKLRRERS